MDAEMARTQSQARLVEEGKRKASNSLLSVASGENEGPPCDAVKGKAVAMLRAPRMDDQKPHVLMQGFDWESCNHQSGWYKELTSHVPKLKEAGVDMLWL